MKIAPLSLTVEEIEARVLDGIEAATFAQAAADDPEYCGTPDYRTGLSFGLLEGVRLMARRMGVDGYEFNRLCTRYHRERAERATADIRARAERIAS